MISKEFIDVSYTIVLIINALLYVPQASLLFKSKDSADMSFVTFFGFNITQILAIINGFYYRDIALIIGKTSSFITCSMITFLIIFYRLKKKRRK